jgi:hypothetical protein
MRPDDCTHIDRLDAIQSDGRRGEDHGMDRDHGENKGRELEIPVDLTLQ